MPHSDMAPRLIRAQPLTQQGFAAFGDLIAAGAQTGSAINAGTAQRFDHAMLDVSLDGGAPCLTIFRTEAWSGPLRLRCFERHRLGSQSFVPMGQGRCLAIVTSGVSAPDEAAIEAFIIEPGQGLTLRRGVWHHPLITLGAADILVIERGARQVDCEVAPVIEHLIITVFE